jgi:hypothetical protein
MATAKQYLKLSSGSPECEVGPFDSASFGGNLFINGSQQSCAYFNGSYWHITDGAQLGDERLTGGEYGVILGQAKLVE